MLHFSLWHFCDLCNVHIPTQYGAHERSRTTTTTCCISLFDIFVICAITNSNTLRSSWKEPNNNKDDMLLFFFCYLYSMTVSHKNVLAFKAPLTVLNFFSSWLIYSTVHYYKYLRCLYLQHVQRLLVWSIAHHLIIHSHNGVTNIDVSAKHGNDQNQRLQHR